MSPTGEKAFPARRYRAQGRSWLLVGSFLLLMLFVVWLMVHSLWGRATLRYELTNEALVIPYGYEQVVIPRSGIRSVETIKTTRGIREFGTSMPGLKQGRYSFAETGTIFMYATATTPLTVIETGERKYGITPADPEAFRQAYSSGGTGTWQPVGAGSPSGMVAVFAIPSLVSVGVVFLLLTLVQMGRTLTYTLTDDALVITAWRLRLTFPYREMVQVRADSPPGTPWKLAGAGMPGLYWGGFSWKAAGPGLRLYSTYYKPLVLISTRRRTTIGVSPEDQDEFVAELARRIPAE